MASVGSHSSLQFLAKIIHETFDVGTSEVVLDALFRYIQRRVKIINRMEDFSMYKQRLYCFVASSNIQ
jgi:hypothetical protein